MRKARLHKLLLLALMLVDAVNVSSASSVPPPHTLSDSPTEGVITADFVDEATMMDDLLQMLADFSLYMKNDFQDARYPNSIGERCGCFRGEDTMANNEKGVRPNADMSMVSAFLSRYARGKVTLPSGVTWDDIDSMALKSLVFAYSTHKANKLKVCSGGNYWGSVSTSDYTWESSLWAMSVAYSAFFQWDRLSAAQRSYIYAMLKAECDYETERSIPTGYIGDTKAEENGWETNILAATLGLFPDDALSERWYERLRQFAINSYSHEADKSDSSVIDPLYDTKTVADLYVGQNLYSDYTLENHNYFHTSYQNVVMQELGESALALKLFQGSSAKWSTEALRHNNSAVMRNVLNWLALPDGELAMPNGNDWSLFLYDQITSYSTQACFERDSDALMLENMAYKYIKARQTTTGDGSWLLNADVGARRMGVEAHRVMMTWLMHEVASTAGMTPTSWSVFNRRYGAAKLFSTQNIVRSSSDSRFTCFSWSAGLKSYTGYFTQNSPDKNKIIVPYRAGNTGNLIGWYTVSGRSVDASPGAVRYSLRGNSYVMNGMLTTNASTLNNRFALYSTAGNALIYTDYVRAVAACSITGELGGLLAVSTDPLTRTQRTLYYDRDGTIASVSLDGSTLTTFDSPWINIDDEIGVVAPGNKQKAFGDRGLNNSIYTSKLYCSYSQRGREVSALDSVDSRVIVYYSGVTAEETSRLADALLPLTPLVRRGWNGAIAADPDGRCHLLLSHFYGAGNNLSLSGILLDQGAPVFACPTRVTMEGSSATFTLAINRSEAETLLFFILGGGVTAWQDEGDSASITIIADTTTSISLLSPGLDTVPLSLKEGDEVKASVVGGAIVSAAAESAVPGAPHGAALPFEETAVYDLNGRRAPRSLQGVAIAGGRKWVNAVYGK